MSHQRPESLAHWAAEQLRQLLARGAWANTLPGLAKLREKIGVSRETLEKALTTLTAEGWLAPAAHGRNRRILRTDLAVVPNNQVQKIGWLAWRPLTLMDRTTREAIAQTSQLAQAEEVDLFVAPRSGSQVRHTSRDLEQLIERHPASAWIVQGATLEINAWFAAQKLPTLAVGGSVGDLPVPQIGFDMGAQIAAAVDHLTELGHRRIVLPLPPQTQRSGVPNRFETAFRQSIEAAGVAVNPDYHLPILRGDPKSWQSLLDDLFRFTPPTAFVLYSGAEAAGLVGYLHRRSLRIPQEVSLVVEADEPMLEWLLPSPTRIEFSSDRLARAIWKWTREALRGHVDPTKSLIPGNFVIGQSTGPASHTS
jgi:DNA-binding LacI/PurR family transcriptional regulator